MDFPRLAHDPEDSPADDIDIDAIMAGDRGEKDDEAQAVRLQLFSAKVAKTRDKYVQGRASSGIEREWLEAEEAYNNRDSANRAAATMMDSVAAGYPITTNQARPTRSTVFVGVTRQRTNTAEARLADILLPTDDRNWGIKPTPDPKVTKALKLEHEAKARAKLASQPAQDPLSSAVSGIVQPQQAPGQPPNMPWTPGQPLPGVGAGTQPGQSKSASETWKQALESAEAMQREIDDVLSQCDWNGVQRSVIHDAAVVGVGVVQGPIARNTVKKAWTPLTDASGQTVHVLEVMEETNPASEHVPYWCFFPDPACGTDIQTGNGAMRVQYLTERKVRDLAKQPGYLKSQIRKVLEEGPQSSSAGSTEQARARMRSGDTSDATPQGELFEVWTYWGVFDAEDMESAGVELPDDHDPLDAKSGCVVMINNTVVKAFLHPMSGGDLPFDVFVWEKRPDHWAGYGVPYLVKWQQRVINGAWRMMMDNAGSTVGSQIVVKSGVIQPADKQWELSGRKIWWCTDENADVRQAFASFDFNSHQQEYAAIIEMAEKFMDQESMVPAIAQGEHEDVPDTVGGMQILMASANTVVRRLVKQYDDSVTRPHIRRYYDWMMEHSENAEIKGDFVIDARGSSSLVVRDIQNQAFLNLLQIAGNPLYGVYVDPKKLFERALQAQHIDPAEILRPDEEIAQIQAQQEGKGPTDPKVQAALITAQARLQAAQAQAHSTLQLEQARAQTTLATEQIRAEAQNAFVSTEAGISKDDNAAKLIELQLKERLAMLEYAQKHQMSIEQVKADLAKVAMQTQTQKELAQMKMQMDAIEAAHGRTHEVNMHHIKTVAEAAAEARQHPPEVATVQEQ